MRALRRAACVLVLLPVVAFAQDSRPDATGTLLLEALPPSADLVIHTPNLPRLLASAPETGFGTAEAWGAAFRAQLRTWGAEKGDSQRLVEAGERILAAADGEVLLASMPVQPFGTPPRDRGVVFAFRSALGPAALGEAVDAVIASGLRIRWPEEPRKQTIAGQSVTILSSESETIYVAIAGNEPGAVDTRVDAPVEAGLRGGLVLVTDHPQTIAVMLRGLDRAIAGAKEPDRARRLEVRWGAGDARWVGWTYFQRESASWQTKDAAPLAIFPAEPAPVVGLAMAGVRDVPLFPRPLPAAIKTQANGLSQSPLPVVLGTDGGFAILPVPAAADASAAKPVAGRAASGGWLRAIRTNALATPIRGLDGEALDGVIASLAATQTATVHEWKAASEPGEIRGPAWHGPATLMALRVLDDIRNGVAPGLVPGEPPPPPPRPTAPLAPPKPRDPLPPPSKLPEAPSESGPK